MLNSRKMVLFSACLSSLQLGLGCTGASGSESSLIEQYIRGDEKTALVFEVDATTGFSARSSVTSHFIPTLSSLLDKPEGISVVSDETLSARGGTFSWSDAELFALADDTFNLDVSAETAKMHVLILDGHHASDVADNKVLGVAWANRHLAIFAESIESACANRLPPLLRQTLCDRAEATVWLHEIGHILGLVDNGLPMVEPHRDPNPEHGAHDANSECVMYWTIEGESVIDLIRDRADGSLNDLPDFDAQCEADIAAVRDRP